MLEVIRNFGLDKAGYRLITNDGKYGNEDIPHFRIHILGGENLGGLR
jgi:diadenosine tetraphosphate (Ap4A) HIT family hydrolase